MTGKQLRDRIDSVTYLTSLEDSSDRNKKMIVEEGAIPPLLKLLKDGGSAEAQIAAANAISSLVDCVERTEAVAVGVPVIVKVLGSSSMKVRVSVAELVARMASEKVRDEKGRSAAGSAFFNAADATGGVDGAVKNASAAFARPRHRYSNSVDASSSGSRSVESSVFGEIIEAKKAMPPDKLAELWSIDPKRAKRLV